MVTLLNLLKSQPMAALSKNPADLTVLISGHFLISEALISIPASILSGIPITTLSRWSINTTEAWILLEQISEYIRRYQSISEWHYPSNEIKIGSLVQFSVKHCPPTKWPFVPVLSLHPAENILTRAGTIKTTISTLTRQIYWKSLQFLRNQRFNSQLP